MRQHDTSYLLRVWRDGRGNESWRASLKDLRTQEVKTFHTLADLAAHIAEFETVPEEGDGGT